MAKRKGRPGNATAALPGCLGLVRRSYVRSYMASSRNVSASENRFYGWTGRGVTGTIGEDFKIHI